MPFTTVFRTARRLFRGQMLYFGCMTEALRRRRANRLFSRTVNKRAGLRLAKAPGQQDILLGRRFLKRKVACRELFSNYHGY